MNRCYAEVNLKNLRENFKIVKSKNEDKKIMAVVKANSYGHGSVECSKELIKCGAEYLAVATIKEAEELREVFDKIPILILGPIYDKQDIQNAITRNITLSITSKENAYIINKEAESLKRKSLVHIAIDTGMRRVGIETDNGVSCAVKEINEILKMDNLDIEGIFTHFASSDAKDISYMNEQYAIFEELIKNIDFNFKLIHCSNSAAIEFFDKPLFNMVRPGIILYGYSSRENSKIKLNPVLSWKCKITHIKNVEEAKSIGYSQNYITKKKSKIATIPVGYADGFSRDLSNKGIVYINNVPCNIVGNVCMDQCMVDITHLEKCTIGDTVELISTYNSADEMAKKCNTISYEVLCNISSRVPRVYIKQSRA